MNYSRLIQRAIKGDSVAFCELVALNKENLYKIAFAYTKNEDDALEIIDESVYKAYLNLEKLRKSEYFSTWITRILINTSIDYCKKKEKLILIDDTFDLDNISYQNMDFPDNSIELISNRMDLYNAMDRLNSKYKTLLILRYFNDLTIAQIAEILELPVGTIKSNLHRAIKQLRSEIEEV